MKIEIFKIYVQSELIPIKLKKLIN